MVGRALVWGCGAAGLASVTFHWHPSVAFQAGIWSLWCYCQGRRECYFKGCCHCCRLFWCFHSLFPPSYFLSSQSVASVTRTGQGWAITMPTLTLPAKRVMKPASRRPALPLSTEMKTTNVSSIFPLPLRSFSGMLPPPALCLAEAGVIAWLHCEWLVPGCLELISHCSHQCWLS